MTTKANLLLGSDYEGVGEGYCHTLINYMKNHWRMSDPCANLTNAQPGMILSDEDDNKLYHVTDLSAPCEEILQEDLSSDKTPIFTSVELGANNVQTTSRVRAYLSSAQDDIANGAWVDVTLDAENFDSGDDFNTGTYTFTTPVAGYYQVNVGVQMHDCVVGQTYYAGVEVDGAVVLQKLILAAVTWHHFTLSDILYIAAGKDVLLQVQHTDVGDTLDLTVGSSYTYMSLHLLSI